MPRQVLLQTERHHHTYGLRYALSKNYLDLLDRIHDEVQVQAEAEAAAAAAAAAGAASGATAAAAEAAAEAAADALDRCTYFTKI